MKHYAFDEETIGRLITICNDLPHRHAVEILNLVKLAKVVTLNAGAQKFESKEEPLLPPKIPAKPKKK